MRRETVAEAARRLVERYGEDAPAQAARKASKLQQQGWRHRRKDWLRIVVASRAVLEPRRPAP